MLASVRVDRVTSGEHAAVVFAAEDDVPAVAAPAEADKAGALIATDVTSTALSEPSFEDIASAFEGSDFDASDLELDLELGDERGPEAFTGHAPNPSAVIVSSRSVHSLRAPRSPFFVQLHTSSLPPALSQRPARGSSWILVARSA